MSTPARALIPAEPPLPGGRAAARPGRTIAVWSPDWPVVTAVAAARLPTGTPAAVLADGVVLACTGSARAAGVRRGLRRREAQHRCPDLVVLPRDLAEEARAFEPVVVAVEAAAPGVEVIRPGLCAVSARGPARYFGGDAAAAAHLAAQASAAGPADGCLAGVAEGSFAAALAARAGEVVRAGQTPGFLAAYPVDVLARPELADLLRRLGLRTLGAFAALPSADVLARFGADGAHAHRLARGLDLRPPAARKPPPDLVVSTALDPPADRVEQAAFAARPLADRLHARLGAAGLGCTRLCIEVETERGERHSRLWRHEGILSATRDRRPCALAARRLAHGYRRAPAAVTASPAAGCAGPCPPTLPRRAVPAAASSCCVWCPTRSSPTAATNSACGRPPARWTARRPSGRAAPWPGCRACSASPRC